MNILKTLNLLSIFVLLVSSVFAQDNSIAIRSGNIKSDSVLYFFDVGIDKVLFTFGLKKANDIAEERIAEIEESLIMEDSIAAERAKTQLDDIDDKITDEDIIEEIEEHNKEIQEKFTIKEEQILEAVNSYSKIEQLTEGISIFGVETEGLIEKRYIITIENGKVVDIEETESLEGLNTIEVEYSLILKAIEDEEFRENKLDLLLKLKLLYKEESIIESDEFEIEEDEDDTKTVKVMGY